MADAGADKRQWFRLGAGAVITGTKGVLAFERRDYPGSWQLPQGGIERNETPLQALFREIEEETGLTRNDLGAPVEMPGWIGYELPASAESDKTQRGQVHKWFVLKLRADTSRITLKPDGEFRAWEWRDLAALAESTVEFRRPVYRYLAEFVAKLRSD